jgi:hypothetical protein
MSYQMGSLLLHRYRRMLGLALLCLLAFSASSVRAVTNQVVIDGNVTAAGDWNDEVCRADIDSANDATGQKDVTQLCIATNYATVQPATILYVRLDFDDTNFSGSNSVDGCVLFDTDGDGNVNRALCVTLDGNPPTATITLYSCGDSKPLNCASSSALATTASCMVHASAAVNPFSSADNPDTAVECAMPVAETGMTNIVRVNVCSYPSGSPSSNASDCALGSTRLYTNKATGASGETSPSAVTLLAFSGAAGSSGLRWQGLAGVLTLLGAVVLARRLRSRVV